MVIQPREHLRQVVRVGDAVEARERFVCLDKNERVDPLPPDLVSGLLGSIGSQDLTGYPVLEPFRIELASWLGVPRDWVLLTAGSDAAIRSVFEVYVRPGDTVAALRPTFAMYGVYARLFGTTVVDLRYDDDLVLLPELVIAALQTGPRLLLLPNPNSPTGTVFSVDQLAAIVSAARDRGTMVLVDEAYYYFTPITALELVGQFDNLVVTRTFSKAGGLAGVRLGYLVSRPENVEFLQRVKPMYEVSGVAMRMGQYLVRNDHVFQDYAREANAGGRLLAAALAALGLRVFETHANFVLGRVPPETDLAALGAALRRRGYLIKAGFGDRPLTDCIRVTTASRAVLEAFIEAFRGAWADLHRCAPDGGRARHAAGEPAPVV